jgi:hypothetical protein
MAAEYTESILRVYTSIFDRCAKTDRAGRGRGRAGRSGKARNAQRAAAVIAGAAAMMY